MTERFRIYEDVVDDSLEVIPITVWSDKKQQKKYCDALNELNDENERLEELVKETYDILCQCFFTCFFNRTEIMSLSERLFFKDIEESVEKKFYDEINGGNDD